MPADRLSASDCVASSDRTITEERNLNDVEGSGSGPIVIYHPCICLQGLTNTSKNLRQNSGPPGRDLNPECPKHEAGVLITSLRRTG